MVVLRHHRPRLQLTSRKKSPLTRHRLRHAQKAVPTDVPNVAVMASVVAATAAVVVVIAAKAAAPKDDQKDVLMAVRKAALKTAMTAAAMAGAASVGNVAPRHALKVHVRSAKSVQSVRNAR